MRAAVVTAFDSPPAYAEVPAPVASADYDLVVDVVASGLHPRVRSQADGSHYTSTAELPLVPGIDGVGRGADGALRYFVLLDTTRGAMAQQVVIDRRRSVVLPDDVDPIAVAAGMNPAMSSWIALRRRIEFEPGQAVLVLGATGNAGRLAVETAHLLGAGRVVAAGRDRARLAELDARGDTTAVALDAAGAAAADVDVVLDYLWGEPAAQVMTAVVTARAERGRPLRWVQIGSVAGPTAPIPSAALRASGLQLVGSGQGSVETRDILAELPELAAAISRGDYRVDARAMPLAEVATAWAARTPERIVLVP